MTGPPRGAPAAGSWAQTCQLRAASTLRPAPVASCSVTASDPSDRRLGDAEAHDVGQRGRIGGLVGGHGGTQVGGRAGLAEPDRAQDDQRRARRRSRRRILEAHRPLAVQDLVAALPEGVVRGQGEEPGGLRLVLGGLQPLADEVRQRDGGRLDLGAVHRRRRRSRCGLIRRTAAPREHSDGDGDGDRRETPVSAVYFCSPRDVTDPGATRPPRTSCEAAAPARLTGPPPRRPRSVPDW